MRTSLFLVPALALVLTGVQPVSAGSLPGGFAVEILVDGRPVPEYVARGTTYVEALKGKEYAIRLRNPLGVRVAVALSVDGLNTIDARHTSPSTARKWVLAPYETVVISGWQTTSQHARRFYFTSEEQSYAAWMGKTSNLGIVSAVFFRERVREPIPVTTPETAGSAARQSAPAGAANERKAESQAPSASAAAPAPSRDEYAATGIGREMEHEVRRVYLDLDPTPVASIDIRYEYREQLTRLGVLPRPPAGDVLARRERARGFERGFCPAPR
jgi:hypothetical protein